MGGKFGWVCCLRHCQGGLEQWQAVSPKARTFNLFGGVSIGIVGGGCHGSWIKAEVNQK